MKIKNHSNPQINYSYYYLAGFMNKLYHYVAVCRKLGMQEKRWGKFVRINTSGSNKNNQELTERDRKLITDLAPLAIDSLLLQKDKDTAKNQANEIIKEAIKAIQKNFAFEEIQYDTNFAEMFVRAELYKKIGAVA